MASLPAKDAVAAQVVARAAAHLADSLESAVSSVTGASATAVGGLLRIPEVSAAFEDETRRRGIDLTVASGTARDGALALGPHIGEGRALRARAPYLLCSARSVSTEAAMMPLWFWHVESGGFSTSSNQVRRLPLRGGGPPCRPARATVAATF